jgi:hypothetical protein
MFCHPLTGTCQYFPATITSAPWLQDLVYNRAEEAYNLRETNGGLVAMQPMPFNFVRKQDSSKCIFSELYDTCMLF